MYTLKQRISYKIHRAMQRIRETRFHRKMRQRGTPRPSSAPYISSDSFRALADHVYDGVDADTSVADIKHGDLVFVSSLFIDEYFQYIHPQIQQPYVLITHEGILPTDEERAAYIDEKIIHWFSKNTLIEHPKITPLPIGLENLYKYIIGIPHEFEKVRAKINGNRKDKILYEFKVATNPREREKALKFLEDFEDAETYDYKIPHYYYLKRIADYMFIASPPGAGQECHRTWEAMYVGTVPIVKRSVATEYFAGCGAPMWVIDSWDEIESVDLEEKYEEIQGRKNDDVLWMDYWVDKIEEQCHKTQ